MAKTGPRFAPHHRWCRERVAALIAVMVDLPSPPALSQDEIEAALQGLEDRRLIWRGLGLALENQRAADWLLALEPTTDVRVDHDELPRLAAGSVTASFPTLAA